jgi:DNA repair exonuclease SbcCD ATPase subunit
MKEIKLNKLVIENFKCFQLLEINFNGQNMIIKGANGTGKTTIMDAINWLLFKKNSQGNQDFSVKPLDHYGNTKKSVVISVYGEFDVDGENVSLKRTMEEQWSRKRGATEATFTGNTYSYEINNVPSKSEKEFKEFVDELCNENLFRLITNPHYFSSLDKKEKRKILIDSLKETLTDIEIITNDPELAELKKFVDTHTIEELQAIKKAELKKLTKQLGDYVPRIDELQRLITSESEEEDLDAIADLKIKIDIVKEKIEQLKMVNAVDDNLALINQINADILKLKNDLMIAEKDNPYKLEKENNLKQYNNELRNCEKAQQENNFEIKQIKMEIDSLEYEIERHNDLLLKSSQKLIDLRNKSKAVAYETFNDFNCPLCGTEYTGEKLEQAKEKFNIGKANALEEIKKEGLQTKELVGQTEETINLLTIKLNQANEKLEDLETKAPWFNERIEESKQGIDNLESQPILESVTILGLISAISDREE